MERGRRVSTWLRLACGFVLAVGFSTATAAATTGEQPTRPATTALSHLSVTAAAAPTTALRAPTALRHAVAKHHLPVMAGAVAAAALGGTALAALAVRRRRTNPALRHHALSHGARAPPAVSCC